MGWNHQPANPQRTQTKTDTAGHSEHDMVKVRSDVRAVRLECREARQSFVFTFQDLKASKKIGLVKGLYMGLTIYTLEIWHRYPKLTYFNGVTFQTIILGIHVSFRGWQYTPWKINIFEPQSHEGGWFRMNLRISISGVNFWGSKCVHFPGCRGLFHKWCTSNYSGSPYKPISIFNGSCPGSRGLDHCSGREMQVVMMGPFLGAFESMNFPYAMS